MKRLLICGSSHVGALKLGWQAIRKDVSGVRVNFLAAPSKMVSVFRAERNRFGLIDQGTLSEKDWALLHQINRKPVVNLNSYDAIVEIRDRVHLPVIRLLRNCRIDGIRDMPSPTRLSTGAFWDLVAEPQEFIAPRPEFQNRDAQQVAVLPTPRVSETCLASDRSDHPFYPWVLAHKELGNFAELMDQAEEVIAGRMRNRGWTFITQPRSTIAESGFSKGQYSRGSIGLGGSAHGEQDFAHMNEDYGQIMVRRILETLFPGA